MSHKKRNWSQYNKKLVNRGRITFWIDKDLAKNPFNKPSGKGRPSFSDAFLVAALSLRCVYSLSFRSLQGFLIDFMALLHIDCPVPHYSLFCKRMKNLNLPKLSSRRPMHLLIDASGVKVIGEGEWKVKVHGAGSRRKWIKLHIAVDERSQEVVVYKATDSNTADSSVVKDLLENCFKNCEKNFSRWCL